LKTPGERTANFGRALEVDQQRSGGLMALDLPGKRRTIFCWRPASSISEVQQSAAERVNALSGDFGNCSELVPRLL
jgi:hypothetical protein